MPDEEQRSDRADDLTGPKRARSGVAEAAAAGAAAGSGGRSRGNAAALGERETELRLVQSELNMLRSFENLGSRQPRLRHVGVTASRSCGSLAEYPGPQDVVFFSEGLPVIARRCRRGSTR